MNFYNHYFCEDFGRHLVRKFTKYYGCIPIGFEIIAQITEVRFEI